MSINKRQQIMTKLVAQLATIKKVNGYELDFIPAQIRQWEPATLDPQGGIIAPVNSDFINLQDSSQSRTTGTIGADDYELIIDFEYYTTGTAVEVKMRKFAADLVTFVKKNRLLDGLIDDMMLSEMDSTEIFHDIKRILVYKREISIIYTTGLNNPYNLT